MKGKKIRKRTAAVLAATMMAGTVLYPMQGTVLIHAETTTSKTANVNGLTWTYEEVTNNNKTYARITKVNVANTTVLAIPSTLNGVPVGKIGTNLLKSNKTVTKVTIPSTVYEVESWAFYGCEALKSIVFTDNVNATEKLDLKIGVCSFEYCTNLQTVSFRKNIGLLTILSQAFEGCENLKIEEFISDVNFSYSAFRKCYSLENLVFKGNAILTGDVFKYAFQDDETEKKITFEKDVEMVYFQGAPLTYCSGLREVEFKGKVTLCEGAFECDNNLKKITWGEGLDGEFSAPSSIGGTMLFYKCDALKTFEFRTGNVHVGNFRGDVPELDKVIYDSDIQMDYWFDAIYVVFKGNVEFTKKVSTDSSRTKNIYFYKPDLNLSNLKSKNINIYGIKGSEVEEYSKSQTSCAFKDIISGIEVKGMDDNVYNTTYILDNGPIDTITPKELGLKVYASYYTGNSKEKLEIPQSVQTGESGYFTDGYGFSYEKLNAGLNNDFFINFSGQKTDIQVLLQHRNLTQITAEVKKDAVTGTEQTKILEGQNKLTKEDIIVTASYDHGENKVVTDEELCVIQNHDIVPGTGNQVKVSYTDPYTGVVAETVVDVIGTEKTPEENLRVSYNYVDYGKEQNGVIVGTKINENNLKVEQWYDNGTFTEVKEHVTSGGEVKEIGESESNKITVTDPQTKRSGTIIIKGIGLGSLNVNYKGGTCIVGDIVDLNDIEINATLEDGTAVEKIDKADVKLSKTILNNDGNNDIVVTYGNLSRVITIPAIKKEVNNITVALRDGVEEAIIGGRLDESVFVVTEFYNNNTQKEVENPDIQLKDYEIKEGENTLIVVYLGKEYQIKINGVEVISPKEFKATYVGTAPLETGQEIDLNDIKVEVFMKDGTSRVLPMSEYEFLDKVQKQIYVKSYAITIPVQGISETENPVQTMEPGNSSTATPNVTVTPNVTEVPVVTVTPNVTEIPVVTQTPAQDSPKPETTESVSLNTPTPQPENTPSGGNVQTPTIAPTSSPDEGVVFQIACNAKDIKLALNEKTNKKVYSKKTIHLSFETANVSNLQYQIVKKGKKTASKNWKKVKGDLLSIKKETPLSRIYFKYKNKNGEQVVLNTVYFSIDKSKPITNVKQNKSYSKIKLTFKDRISGVKKATLNGKSVKTGTTIKKKGSYKLVVTDNAGNKLVRKFKIK